MTWRLALDGSAGDPCPGDFIPTVSEKSYLKVLVADDNRVSRLLLESILRSLGYDPG